MTNQFEELFNSKTDSSTLQRDGLITLDKMTGNIWAVARQLPIEILEERLAIWNKEFASFEVKHVKSGNWYEISHFSLAIHDGVKEWAVNYRRQLESGELSDALFTRVAREFFDGRFV